MDPYNVMAIDRVDAVPPVKTTTTANQCVCRPPQCHSGVTCGAEAWDEIDHPDAFEVTIHLNETQWLVLYGRLYRRVTCLLREDVWLAAGVREPRIIGQRTYPDLRSALAAISAYEGMTPAAFIIQALRSGHLDTANFAVLFNVLSSPLPCSVTACTGTYYRIL